VLGAILTHVARRWDGADESGLPYCLKGSELSVAFTKETVPNRVEILLPDRRFHPIQTLLRKRD